MNNNKNINIACSSDDNFAQHMCVTICSLIKNCNHNYHLNIYIVDGGISKKNKEKIKKSLERYLERLTLKFLTVNKEKFLDLKESRYITRASYFRIELPKLLPNVDRLLYLDSDILVINDISEIYFKPFSDNFLFAVRDTSLQMEEEYEKILKIPNRIGYFNSGVMLLDMKKFRENNISEKIINFIKAKGYLSSMMDQTGLNAVLFDKWAPISPRWNQLSSILFERNYLNTTYSKIIFKEAKSNPSIIHYSSHFSKPWNFEAIGKHKRLYYSYLSETEFFDFKSNFNYQKVLKKIMYVIYFYATPYIIKTMVFKIYNNIKKDKYK